jgi:hypothetical protein
MIDIAVLAGTLVTSFLAPYAKMGLEKLVDHFGSSVGENAAKKTGEIANKIVQRLTASLSGPTEKPVVDMLKDHPAEAAPLMKAILKEKLEKDPDLAKELQDLLSALKQTAGKDIGAMTATITIGDHNFNNNNGDVTITGNLVQ